MFNVEFCSRSSFVLTYCNPLLIAINLHLSLVFCRAIICAIWILAPPGAAQRWSARVLGVDPLQDFRIRANFCFTFCLKRKIFSRKLRWRILLPNKSRKFGWKLRLSSALQVRSSRQWQVLCLSLQISIKFQKKFFVQRNELSRDQNNVEMAESEFSNAGMCRNERRKLFGKIEKQFENENFLFKIKFPTFGGTTKISGIYCTDFIFALYRTLHYVM